MDAITVRAIVAAVIVSLIAGLAVWGVSGFVFKQPNARTHGFVAFVVVLAIYALGVLY
jgi:predicted permease